MKKTIILSSIILASLNANAAYFAMLNSDNYTIQQKTEIDKGYALAGIDLDRITSDSVINKNESESIIKVTGVVTGDAKVNDDVIILLNDVEISRTKVLNIKNGENRYTFVADVSGLDLAENSGLKVVTARINGQDNFSNEYNAETTENYQIDLMTELDFYAENEIVTDNILKIGGWIENNGFLMSIRIFNEDSSFPVEIPILTDDNGYLFFEKNIDISALNSGLFTVEVIAADQYNNFETQTLTITKS